ncbi:monovalent cation/H+ antiporter subunit E [Natronorarus salvus]|uniref:monovalent cation/H+ antiporter subunit E n=1 Tax=Natronorarus salvus TaxID=3117733 RepID=UPI002F26B8A5
MSDRDGSEGSGHERLLVPISNSVTARQTVDHAVSACLETGGELHLAFALAYEADVPEGTASAEEARRLLARAEAWAAEASDDTLTVETALLGADEYLFGPRDYAEAIEAYVEERGIDRVILDPEYRPGATAPMLQPLEGQLTAAGVEWSEAPVERSARHARFLGPGGRSRFVGLFAVSYLFYLILGDPTYPFDLITGAASATIVAVTLSQVTFSTPLHPTRTPARVLRGMVYVPYLLFEIVKANLAISLVILRPSMPIDPKLTRVNAAVRSGLPLMTLANSITLTPGTLTVRANDQRLVVHTLIAEAREDLFDGGLERAVRFVFYGREAATIATPRERGDTEILQGDDR